MKGPRRFLPHLLLGLSIAGASVARASDIEEAAKTLVGQLAAGDFKAATSRFDSRMQASLPADKLGPLWNQLVGQVGAFKGIESTRLETQEDYRVVFVRTRFEKMPLDAKVVFDAAANVAGLFFTPVAQPAAEWVPPDYVQRDAFDDKPITIESGGYHLSGFISMPKSPGQHPGVVLVHGSGPHDADETVGGNKPFRDLAWGLASRGIAVIRYVKRTAVMSQKPDVNLTGLTVREETVDDARVALSVLARTAGVDSNRAFVVGHSLGANLAPRIAAGDRRVVGLVLMAGSVRPLEDVALEQVRFLANRDSTVDEREKKQIEAMQKAAQTIKSPALRDTTIVDFLGAPIPGSYWLDLRSYRPGEAAARAGVPILVLRGERDYQVAATDFEAWKKALAGVPGVTFKSYPGLNHLFVAGTGAPNPEEYMKPGHVAPEVVADLAAWIADPRGARLSGGDQRNKRIK